MSDHRWTGCDTRLNSTCSEEGILIGFLNLECGNNHLGSIRAQNFLDKLNNNQLFKEDCTNGLLV
jgi:hypothetical protein